MDDMWQYRKLTDTLHGPCHYSPGWLKPQARATLLEVKGKRCRDSDMPRQKSLAATVLIGAFFGGVAMAAIFAASIDAPHLLLLERQQADTVGRVIRLVPESHGQVEIEYRVAGVAHRQILPVYGDVTPVAAGQTLTIFYYPGDPLIAFTAPPGEIFSHKRAEWVLFWWFGALLGGVAAYNFARRQKTE